MSELTFLMNRAIRAFQSYAYQYSSEAELHQSISQMLLAEGIEFKHEHVAGKSDRFDFLIGDGVVVEAKIKGSLPVALRQCKRYAERDDVKAVILVTTRYWGRIDIEEVAEMNGKPVRLVKLQGVSF